MAISRKAVKYGAMTVGGLLVATVLFLVGRHATQERQRRKREAHYQAALGSYRQALSIGSTRKQVEQYLRNSGTGFLRMCCVEHSGKHSVDDLVKVGAEEAPWFCSEHNVYVALQFTDFKRPRNSFGEANDLDTLSAVTIFHWLEGCL